MHNWLNFEVIFSNLGAIIELVEHPKISSLQTEMGPQMETQNGASINYNVLP